MSEAFFCSDLHLGHLNSLTFTRDDDSPLRPFHDVDDMNWQIIENINSRVGHKDNLYILGDATMPKWAIPLLSYINGKKKLIVGNHDHRASLYDGIFSTIVAYAEFDGCVLSHVPVHTSQLDVRWKRNIHGHLHANHVVFEDGKRDVRYYNTSIDCYASGTPGEYGYHSGMNFMPKSWDEIKSELYLCYNYLL